MLAVNSLKVVWVFKTDLCQPKLFYNMEYRNSIIPNSGIPKSIYYPGTVKHQQYHDIPQ